MSFDLKKFSKAKFQARTEAVAVPALADFFEEDSKPEFLVRGLTGEEMARANEALNKSKNIAAILEAIAGQAQNEKIKGLKDVMGLGDDMPGDLAKRIEVLAMGCVEPVLDIQNASKIFRVAPVDGYALTNKILVLSGQGMTLGEQPASGRKKKSKRPAT
ncbi:hypothetical protein [Desulfonatronovibrio hydrogenovorans]|uniref:hypothetical protein n=1 Tax=Desulfonatronovibrio hydrogenovorans TaxID=53245 RepID=UPI0006901182|nr:hypothetical protein [Desulfonatronovibrio hydrogenovorans]